MLRMPSNKRSRSGKTARPPAESSPAGRARHLEEHTAELQRLLFEASARYRALCSFLPIPLLLIDPTGIIREANEAFFSLMGGLRGRHLGLSFSGCLHPEDRPKFRRHLARCRHKQWSAARVEVRLCAPGGIEIPVLLVSDGAVCDPTAYWMALVDLRDKRQLQAQSDAVRDIQEEGRQAADARDLFVAALSHELRSPIAAITAAATVIQRTPTERLDLPRLAGLISRAAAAQIRLVDDLHDLTNITRGNLTMQLGPVDLQSILTDALETFAPEVADKSLTVDIVLKAANHTVEADPVRVRQVFWNLVKNAIKFTPSGGHLAIRSWNRSAIVVVEVSDSGIGIAPDMLGRIFGRFEQASRGSGTGLGLGLPIAKGIVEALRGKIFVASPGLGKGARFVVELPVVGAVPAAEPVGQQRSLAPAGKSLSILLVEDNAELAEAMGLVLRAAGYGVTTAGSMTSALAVDLQGIDLVVSDIELPDGSGRELVRRIHDRRRIPAIAVSGFVTQAEALASRTAGFLAHLKKPLDLDTLQSAIDEATRLSTA